MPLHLTYRPKDFSEFFGNREMIESLKSVAERESDDLPHAWLFIGNKGCGKTTLSRIVSTNYLGCKAIDENPDYHEINCGSHGKIDTVREIEKQATYNPIKSKNRVWVLDEAHMLGQGGASEKNSVQNALLKILEDAPKRGHLILCTTDPQRLIGTIHSRCHTFKVNPLSDDNMQSLINNILQQENINDFPQNAIEAIIDSSQGHPRDALKILDQVIDLEDDAIIGAIQNYETLETEVKELCQLLLKKGSWPRIAEIIKKLRKEGKDCETVRRAIIGYMSVVIMNPKGNAKELMIRCKDLHEIFRHPTYNNGWPDIIFGCYEASVI